MVLMAAGIETFGMIAGAGFLAGAMNALAGGGSFVSLPALIGAGVPSVQANTSSTLALWPGSVASVWVYRKGLGDISGVPLRPMLLVTLAGGLLGAYLLLHTSSKIFDTVLPWLLLTATLMLAFSKPFSEWLRNHLTVSPAFVIAVQFLLGIYGGYFGGAVGLMMLSVWGLLGGKDPKSLNAPRVLMASATNAMAVLTFIAARAIRWPETLVMLVFATAGGYAGAWVGHRTPAKVIRVGTLMVAATITTVFFVRAYFR